MKKVIFLCLFGFGAISKVSAQESAFRNGAVIANNAALVLQNGTDETLVADILFDLNRLRQAAEADNTGIAARAYFETIDRVDVDALRKLLAGRVVVVDELKFDAPKTSEFSSILGNLKIDRSCLVAVEQQDNNLYKSVRNIPKVSTIVISDLNAGDICNRQKMLFTKDALLSLINGKQNEN